MLRLKDFTVENWATWGQGTLDLSLGGVSFVRGKNLDVPGSNGSGKSAFFNGLYALIFGDHQFSARKRSLKSITTDRTRMRLRGWSEDEKFSISMQRTQLSIRTGKTLEELGNRTKASSQNAVADLIGMSPDLWSSMVHLNGIAANPLIRGTSSQRCQFLEAAFDLNRWAEKYSRVGDVVAGMKRAKSDLDDARQELKGLPDPINTAALHKRLDAIDAKRDACKKSVDRARDVLAEYRALPPRPKRDVAFYTDAAEKIERSLAEMKKRAAARDRYVEAKARYDENQRQQDELRARMKECKSVLHDRHDFDVDAMQEKLDLLRRLKKQHDYAVEHDVPIIRWRNEASDIARKHGIKYRSDEELRAMSRAWVSSLRDGSSKCPVCGSAFKGSVERKRLDVLRDLLDDLPDDLTLTKPKSHNFSLIDVLENRIKFARDYHDAKARLSRIERVDVPERVDYDPAESVTLARKLSSANELLSRARAWENVEDRDVDAIEDDLRKKERQLEEWTSLADALRTKIAEAEAAAKTRESVEKRIAKLDEEVRLQPVYRALHQAYSTNGMRMWMLSEMLEAIVSSLNANSPRRQVSYGYKLSRNRDLTLTASNIKGTFDVRLLSGGEACFFCVNLVTALLPLLPDRKRCSILVLDEVDANVDDTNRPLLAGEYIPRLAEIVPSLFIVTPIARERFYIEGAREILVEKNRNGESRFVS